ncbi:MAG: WGR domain-containing protein, partial [Nitrospira sp.]|nr:WGR domain-containing protein [Nitrospira sp.]
MIRETVTLYYRQDGSDKIYRASIEELDGGCVVTFAYGRRGAALKAGTKTSAPVPFDQAKKIYDRLVKSKTAKGYSPGEDGTPYAGTDHADRDTGIRPQLLNSIDEGEAERYLADDDFWLQEKHDGQRVLVQKVGGIVTG